MRRRLAAALAFALSAGTLAAVGQLTGSAQAAAYPLVYQTNNKNSTCNGTTKHITGTIKGYDGNYVNAFIGMDLNTTVGGKLVRIDGGGCSGSTSRAGAGYGVTIHVNYNLPAQGAAPGSTNDATFTWYADIPGNTSNIYFEVYPKKVSSQPKYGDTDQTYYSYSMQPNITIPSGGGKMPDIYMPVVKCGTLSTGAVTGYFYKKNSAGSYVKVNGVRVAAFSQGPKTAGTPAGKGPFGFGSWTNTSGYASYTVGKLASGGGKGQAYTLIASLKDGSQKQFYMYNGTTGVQSTGVFACKTARFDLKF